LQTKGEEWIISAYAIYRTAATDRMHRTIVLYWLTRLWRFSAVPS